MTLTEPCIYAWVRVEFFWVTVRVTVTLTQTSNPKQNIAARAEYSDPNLYRARLQLNRAFYGWVRVEFVRVTVRVAGG